MVDIIMQLEKLLMHEAIVNTLHNIYVTDEGKSLLSCVSECMHKFCE